MLHFTRWKMIAILAVVLAGIVAAIPNLFSRATVESWPSWVPSRQLVLSRPQVQAALIVSIIALAMWWPRRSRA